MQYTDIKDEAMPIVTTPVNGTADAPSSDPAARAKSMLMSAMASVKESLPDMSNLYLQPLDPAEELTMADRADLIWKSKRPWGEFFDISNFNLPALNHVSKRISNNIKTYFYNYFLLTVIHIILFGLMHFGPVLALLLWVAFTFFLLGHHQSDIQVTDNVKITYPMKMAIVAVAGIFALTAGHVLSLVFSIAFFLFVLVGVHGTIRQDVDVDSAAAPSV